MYVLLLIISMVGSGMTVYLLHENVNRKSHEFNRLMQNTVIEGKFQSAAGKTDVPLPIETGLNAIRSVFVDKYYAEMHAEFFLEEPAVPADVYGTNDFAQYFLKTGMKYSPPEETNDLYICYISKRLSELSGLGSSDVISVSCGNDAGNQTEAAADLMIMGVYDSDTVSLVCPYQLFLEKDGLLSSVLSREQWQYFTELILYLKPAYNETYISEVKPYFQMLAGDEWNFMANDKEIYLVLEPLADSIKQGKKLMQIVSVLLNLLTACTSVMLSATYRKDILIARLFGEKKIILFLRSLAESLIVILAGMLIMMNTTAGVSSYIYQNSICALFSAALSMLLACNKDLFSLYTMEK